MEAAGEGSGRGGGVKEQKRSESGGYEDGGEEETVIKVPPVISMSRSSGEPDPTKSPSSQKEQGDKLQSARAEMGEVREENQRLKRHLDQLLKDYENLQMQFMGIVQQKVRKANKDQEMEEPEFVSLRLGRVSSETKRDEKNTVSSRWKEDEQAKEDLSLGLDCRFDLPKSRESESVRNPSPVNGSEEAKEDAGETCSPGKAPKTMRSGDDEASQLIPVKKARVSVRTRCDTPTMNDGCQWRKYGQKIAKGNPCPRAYYRCTVAPSCPVRKQVQRCAEDMSILITTYEGTHNHPLPMAATAMASTTSAAASMLLSGSSTSRPGHSLSATATASDLYGMNFYLADHSKPKPFYLSNSSYNPSSTFPTITLDLTSLPSSSSSPFNKFSSAYPPRCSTTSLNFSSSEPNAMSWGNGFLSYGAQPYDRNQIGNPAMGRPPVDNAYLSYIQKNNPTQPQNPLPETIAAATKAITTDPSFQSALAAALTTIIGNGGAPGNQSGEGDNHGQKSTLGELFPASSTFPPASKSTGCASSFLNLTHSTTSRPGSLMFMPPSLPFSTPKSASTSPGDKRDPSKEF